MVQGFYTAIVALLDKYLPITEHQVYSSDMPWVTPRFKRLIRCKQYAFKVGEVTEYRRLRNQIQRLGKKLRLNYYKCKGYHLYSADERTWWRKVKRFLNLSNGNSFHHLQQQLPDGTSPADVTNESFASVSADLPPLSDDILRHISKDDYCDRFIIDVQDVENRLMRIDLSKAPRPDELPNCILRDLAPLLSQPICAVFNAV